MQGVSQVVATGGGIGWGGVAKGDVAAVHIAEQQPARQQNAAQGEQKRPAKGPQPSPSCHFLHPFSSEKLRQRLSQEMAGIDRFFHCVALAAHLQQQGAGGQVLVVPRPHQRQRAH